MRFDGLTFKKYFHDPENPESLSSDMAGKLYEDKQGYIWVYTSGNGVNRFDPRTEKFKRYYSSPFGSADNSLNAAYDFCEDAQGDFYMASEKGLCSYNKTEEKINLILWKGNPVLPKILNCLIMTSDNRLIAGTDKGVFEVNIKNETVNILPGTENMQITILSMDEDSHENLWVGTWQHGLIKCDLKKKTSQVFTFDDANLHLHNWIFDDLQVQMIGDKEVIWSTVVGSYLVQFDIATEMLLPESLIPYFPEHPENILTKKLMLDRNNSLWITTSYGLLCIDPYKQLFKTFQITPQKSLEYYSSITALYQDELDATGNTIWFAVPTWGLCKYNLKSHEAKWFNKFITPQNDEFTITKILRKNAHELWISSYSGMIKYNTENSSYKIYCKENKTENTISSNYILDIIYDLKNRFWVGTLGGGIHFYDAACDCFKKLEIDSSNLEKGSNISNNINDLALDKNGNIWAARGYVLGSNAAISMVNTTTLEETYYYRNENYPEFPFTEEIFGILPDTYGNIWMGTHGGAVQFNPEKDKRKFTWLTPGTGFQNSRCYGFIQTNNTIWATGNNGIALIEAETQKVIRSYLPDDGLLDESVSVMEVGFDGKIFFGDYAAFQYIDANAVTPNKKIPPVYITDIFVLDKQYLPENNSALFGEYLKLPFKENKIKFEFSALNFTNPENNLFAFMLEGADLDWTYTHTPFVIYNNLRPGKYTFKVKAANDNGIWNETGDSYKLIILSPWYQTIWFYIACTFLAASIIYTIYKVRINQILRLERLRNKISRDLHDDVGSTLSSIHMMSKLAKTQSEKHPEKIPVLLEKISIGSENMMENMSDIVWAVNPKNDTLENMLVRMQQFAADLLEAKNISYAFEVNESILKTKIPLEIRRDFYLIYKEAINNLAKHSACTQAVIRLYLDKNVLHLIVKDNGIGFDYNLQNQGNGLKNYQARSKNINGKVEMQSQIGKGAEMHLSIPLH
ncbi:MAG: triple tyrosine motif-containing protein [Chitinophagales bacterium]